MADIFSLLARTLNNLFGGGGENERLCSYCRRPLTGLVYNGMHQRCAEDLGITTTVESRSAAGSQFSRR
ncbi:MAG TPA: hypothetical protein VF584_24185 [Longimicrobium sp.]|jgi:uncharacterized protein (DUF2237 family)